MPFHRYRDPSYNLLGGSFPGAVGAETYDRLNVTDGGTGGGDGSSNVSPQKSGPHPNAGTYMVAFRDDGTSANANRGIAAVAENTDVLDDIVRGSIPRPVALNVTNPSGTQVTLTGLDVFVGDTALTDPRQFFYAVSQATGEVMYNGTTPIYVTAVDDGAGTPVVGNGFQAEPRLTFSAAVTEDFTLFYGGRASFANAIEAPNRDMSFGLAMRAAVAGFYGQSFYLSGLDERYRRATGPTSASLNTNTPGDGRRINRDGGALQLVAPTRTPGQKVTDPFYALIHRDQQPRADEANIGESDVSGDWNNDAGGDVGMFGYSPHRALNGAAGEYAPPYRAGAALLEVTPRHLRATDGFGGFIPKTAINPLGTATLNPAGAGSNIVQCAAGDIFRNSWGTALRLYADLLLIQRANGDRELYLITGITADNRVTVRRFENDGVGPSFPADESANIQLLQPSVKIGGSAHWEEGGQPRPLDRPLFVAWAPAMTTETNFENDVLPSMFVSPTRAPEGAASTNDTGSALEVGYTEPTTGVVSMGSRFFGHGGTWHEAGRQRVCMHATAVQRETVDSSGSTTITWDATSRGGGGGGTLVITVGVPPGDGDVTIELPSTESDTLLGNDGFQDGDRLTLVIERPITSNRNVEFNFPANFVFYRDEDYIDPSPRRPYVVKFELLREGADWRVTRRDLNLSHDGVLTCSIDDPRADFIGTDSLERAFTYVDSSFTGTIRLIPSLFASNFFDISRDLGFEGPSRIRIVGEGRAVIRSNGVLNTAIRLENQETDISFENIEFTTLSNANAVVLINTRVRAQFKNCIFRNAGPSLQVFERVLFEDCQFFNRSSTDLTECVGIDAQQNDGMGTVDFVRCRLESGGASVAGILHFNVATDVSIQAINFVDCYFLNDVTSFTGSVSQNVGPHPFKVSDNGGYNCAVEKISFVRCVMAGSVGMYMPSGNGVSWRTVEVVDCDVYVRDAANRASKAVAVTCEDLVVRNLKVGSSDTIDGDTPLAWKDQLDNRACDATVATGFSSSFPTPQENACGNIVLVGRSTINVDGIVYMTEQYNGSVCPDVTIVQGSSDLRVMRISGIDVPVESTSGVGSNSPARVCILARGSLGGSFSCRDVSIRGDGGGIMVPATSTGIFTLLVNGVWDPLSPAMVFDNISIRAGGPSSGYGIAIAHGNRGAYPDSGSRTIWNNIHVQGDGSISSMSYGFYTLFSVGYDSTYLRFNGGLIRDVERGMLIANSVTGDSSVDLGIDGITIDNFSSDGIEVSWRGSATPGPIITGCKVRSTAPSGYFYRLGATQLNTMLGVFTGNSARDNNLATTGNLLATANTFYFVGMEVAAERYGAGGIPSGLKSEGVMNFNEVVFEASS